jgi:regulator of protease activity HflC (stomatin/prohibitin superfamily)
VPPPFDVVRRGFDRGQVLSYVRVLSERVRDLESRLTAEGSVPEAADRTARDPLEGVADHLRGLLEAFDDEVGRQRRKAELEATVVTAEARTAAAQMRLEAQAVHEDAVAEARRILLVAREEAAAVRTEATTLRESAIADLRAIRDRMRRSLNELEAGIGEGESPQVIVLDEPGEESPSIEQPESAPGK